MQEAEPRATILVVDDEPFNIDLAEQELASLGFDVISARNGQQALRLADEGRCDMVLLDIMMPEMSGYEVLARLRESGRLASLPVIVISALGELDSVVCCIELGAEDYLPKPFNPTLLKARINATLEKKRLRDKLARQLEITEEVFGKYVPARIAEAILDGRGVLQPVQTEATILYTDIEGFTTIVESMPPARVAQMLNEYFPAVIEPIERHNGIVNQFQGDAMLVTFNVPVDDPAHADSAVRAAQEIQALLKEHLFAGTPLKTRIGINTGEVFAGNVGTGNRINYTVHGDAVNVAARLEQLNKSRGTYTLLAQSTVAALQGEYSIEPVGEVPVPGHLPVRAFSLIV